MTKYSRCVTFKNIFPLAGFLIHWCGKWWAYSLKFSVFLHLVCEYCDLKECQYLTAAGGQGLRFGKYIEIETFFLDVVCLSYGWNAVGLDFKRVMLFGTGKKINCLPVYVV